MSVHVRIPCGVLSIRHLAAFLVALLLALGCRSDSPSKRRDLDEPMMHRLAGSWDVTLRLERPLSLNMDASKLPRTVDGIATFLEARNGKLSFEELSGPTHIGVYDIDLNALGFPPRDEGVIPGLAARNVTGQSQSPVSPGRDSVYIVINPETPRHSLRLTGLFEGDSIRGIWVAESFLGGGGTFTLRRDGGKQAAGR